KNRTNNRHVFEMPGEGGAWGGKFLLPAQILFEGAIGADIHALVAPKAALDVLGKADTIPVRVLEKVLAELLLRHRLFQVVGAPLVVGTEQVGRPGRLLRVKADIRTSLHELVEVAAVLHSGGKVLPGTFAQSETVLIRQKPFQPLQRPEQDAGQFL